MTTFDRHFAHWPPGVPHTLEVPRTSVYSNLAARAAQDLKPDIYLGSPCLFCLKSFGKVPWHTEAVGRARSLPVVQAV